MKEKKKKPQRSPLTPRQKVAYENLRHIWNIKRQELGITQESAAENMGVTQGNVGHYLNGRIGLNVENTLKFARLLRVSPIDIDPELASLIEPPPKRDDRQEYHEWLDSLNEEELREFKKVINIMKVFKRSSEEEEIASPSKAPHAGKPEKTV